MNLYYHSFQVYFSSIHSAFDENYFYLGEDPFPVQTIQILTKIIKFELPYLFVLFISYLLQSYISNKQRLKLQRERQCSLFYINE